MWIRLFKIYEGLAPKYKGGLRDEIQDDLNGHKFWTVEEVHHCALEAEEKLKRKASTRNIPSEFVPIRQ